MIDGLQFALINKSQPPVTSQLLFPPFPFYIAMQGYCVNYSCNSEPILCKIRRINTKGQYCTYEDHSSVSFNHYAPATCTAKSHTFLQKKRCIPNSYTVFFCAMLLRLACKVFRFTVVYIWCSTKWFEGVTADAFRWAEKLMGFTFAFTFQLIFSMHADS